MAATACSTPEHDPRDRTGKVAIHIAVPTTGDFRSSGEFPALAETAEDGGGLERGLAIVFEWAGDADRALANSSYTFGVRGYSLDTKDSEGNEAEGEVFEFAMGYRAYPDLGIDNPTVQPFVGTEFLLIPFMDIGDVDFLGLGVSFNAGLDIWIGHNAAFEIQARFVGIGEDFFSDPRFHHGYVAEAGVVFWL
jgi:hypothetical protein